MTHHHAPRPCTANDQAIGGGCYNCGAGFPERPTFRFRFMRLYIPTGERTEGHLSEGHLLDPTRLDALNLINKWNSQQPGLWQYWLL